MPSAVVEGYGGANAGDKALAENCSLCMARVPYLKSGTGSYARIFFRLLWRVLAGLLLLLLLSCAEVGLEMRRLIPGPPSGIQLIHSVIWHYIGVSGVKMAEETSDIMAARERMIAKRFGGANATRTGGVRRKKKNVHKTATAGKCFVLF